MQRSNEGIDYQAYTNNMQNFDFASLFQLQNPLFNAASTQMLGTNGQINGYTNGMMPSNVEVSQTSQNNVLNISDESSKKRKRTSNCDDKGERSPSKKRANNDQHVSDDKSGEKHESETNNSNQNGQQIKDERQTPDIGTNWFVTPQASSTPNVVSKEGQDSTNYFFGAQYYPQMNNLITNMSTYSNIGGLNNCEGSYNYGTYNSTLFSNHQQSNNEGEDQNNDQNNSKELTSEKSNDSGVSGESHSSPDSTNSGGDCNGEYSNKLVTTANPFNPSQIVTRDLSTISPFDIFCTVPGRLSLLSATTKYRVSVGEIQRRISPPECLNASILGGILRKAKSKDGGKMLRDSLSQINVVLPAGRRKAYKVTSFTSLVEEEAITLAKDYHYICDSEFPAKVIGQSIVNTEVQSNTEIEKLKIIFEHTRIGIKLVCDLLNKDRSPISTNSLPHVLNQNIQGPLTRFSMITHGFGTLSLIGAFNALNNVFDEGSKYIESCMQQPQINLQSGFSVPMHNQNQFPSQMGMNQMNFHQNSANNFRM